jgi:muconate cycloisomerase
LPDYDDASFIVEKYCRRFLVKITKVEAIPVSIPFITDWAIATVSNVFEEGPQALSGYIVVRIHTDEGIVGIGETGRYFEGETMPGIVHTIKTYFEPTLKAVPDPLNIAAVREAISYGVPKGNRFAKTAVDIALHDLVGKALGVPVYTLLGGSYRDKVLVCQSVGVKDVEQALDDAQLYVDQGFRGLKVKIGADPEHDLKLLREIRHAVGDDIDIRVDANQGYSTAVAVPTLARMERYNLSLVEQPVPLWDLDGMRRVRDALMTPIMACESVRTAQDVMAVVKHDAADIINIKLGRPGGYDGAMKMQAVAEAAGLPVTVGTMMELGIGTAAAAHLAAACKNLAYTSDFTGPTLLKDDILTEPVHFEDSYVCVPQGPGLGVEIDEEKLARYRLD